jgi:hypothetical protein
MGNRVEGLKRGEFIAEHMTGRLNRKTRTRNRWGTFSPAGQAVGRSGGRLREVAPGLIQGCGEDFSGSLID